MTREQEYKRALLLETLWKVSLMAIASAIILTTIGIFSGCTPAQDSGSTLPRAAVQGGEIQARMILGTPQGPIILEVGSDFAHVQGEGAEGVEILSWEALGSLELSISGGAHTIRVDASGEQREGIWARCVMGSYSGLGLTLEGAVPGMQCPEESSQLPPKSAPLGGSE